MDDILKNSDTTAALNSSNSFLYDFIDLTEPLILNDFKIWFDEKSCGDGFSDMYIINNEILHYKYGGKYYEENIKNHLIRRILNKFDNVNKIII